MEPSSIVSPHGEQSFPVDSEAEAPKPPRRSVPKLLSGLAVALAFLVLKLKGVFFLFAAKLKLLFVNPFEGFGVAQFLLAGGSMALTIVAYAIKAPLGFAIGFVAMTVLHELGHAVAIRAKGLRAGAMVFIPFVGGAVTLRRQPRSAYDDAQIGLAGPIAGALASFAFLGVYNRTADTLWLSLAFAGFLLNLFNLLPIRPLDGGRVAAAVTRWMWLLGVGIMAWVVYQWRNPLLIVVLILGVFQIYASIRKPHHQFYNVTLAQRTAIGIVYFVLVFVLAFEAASTHRELLRMQ